MVKRTTPTLASLAAANLDITSKDVQRIASEDLGFARLARLIRRLAGSVMGQSEPVKEGPDIWTAPTNQLETFAVGDDGSKIDG